MDERTERRERKVKRLDSSPAHRPTTYYRWDAEATHDIVVRSECADRAILRLSEGVGRGIAFGATFDFDERLRGTTPLAITGTLGANHPRYCDSKNPRATEGFPADREAPIQVGSLTGLASAPHRKITTAPLFDQAVTRDYERFLAKVRDDDAGRLAGALLALLGVGDARRPSAPREDLPDAARFIMTLPGEATEVMTFTLFATREGRAISAACSATDVARFWGAYDGPRFSMCCLIIPSAHRIPRELRASGHGSFALFACQGELRSREDPKERAAVQSLEVGMMGAGVVSGFEVRNQVGQLAAASFYEAVNEPGQAQSLAWPPGALPRMERRNPRDARHRLGLSMAHGVRRSPLGRQNQPVAGDRAIPMPPNGPPRGGPNGEGTRHATELEQRRQSDKRP